MYNQGVHQLPHNRQCSPSSQRVPETSKRFEDNNQNEQSNNECFVIKQITLKFLNRYSDEGVRSGTY